MSINPNENSILTPQCPVPVEQRRNLSIHQRALSEEISRSEFSAGDKELGGPKLTPLDERSGTMELEIVP